MRLRAFAAGALVLLVGCAGDDTSVGGDAGTDATTDANANADGTANADANADALADAAADADAAAIGDAAADAVADAASDADAGFDAGPQGVGCGTAGYPPGPYGTTVGSILANLAFTGLVDANGNGNVADDPPVTICLGRYHGASAEVLVIHSTAAWCAPCASEEPGWVQLAAQNAGTAVFLEAMAQNVAGLPATLTTIKGWATKYGVANDLAIDPQLLLSPYFDYGDAGLSFPAHLVVRTDTMTIVRSTVGGSADAGDVQSEIDDVVAQLDAGSD